MENQFSDDCGASCFDEATLREMLSFIPPDTVVESQLSALLRKQSDMSDLEDFETLSESTTASKSPARKHKKRAGRRARTRQDKRPFAEAPAVRGTELPEDSCKDSDPLDLLQVDPELLQSLQSCSARNKREAVTEIKNRMHAIEESIQQAKAILHKLISQRQ